MNGRYWLAMIGCTFALAGYVTVQVNRMPHFALTPALQTELASLLHDNGLKTVPVGNTQRQSLNASVRFDLPTCAGDGFLLPVPDIALADMQTIWISEYVGMPYKNRAIRMVADKGVLAARLARAIATFRTVLGLPAPRNGHTVLVVFVPQDCFAPMPDLQAFWAHPVTKG